MWILSHGWCHADCGYEYEYGVVQPFDSDSWGNLDQTMHSFRAGKYASAIDRSTPIPSASTFPLELPCQLPLSHRAHVPHLL